MGVTFTFQTDFWAYQ